MPHARIDKALAALVLAAAFVLAWHTVIAHDLPGQIAAGRWIAEHGIPSTDPFSWWVPGREWVELRWLWCLAVHGGYELFGPNGLIVATTAAVVAVAALVIAAGGGARGAGALGAALFLALAHTRFQVRPEIVTFLLVAIWLTLLERYRRGGSAWCAWALVPLQVVWTNTHTLAVLGPVTIWIFALAEALGPRFLPRAFPRSGLADWPRLKPLLAVSACVTAGMFASPWFVEGALFPFELLSEIGSEHAVVGLIEEFRSPFDLGFANPFVLAWAVGLLMTAACLFAARGRASASSWAVCAAYGYLSSLAMRNAALFGIVAGFGVAWSLAQVSAAHSERAQRALVLAARALAAGFALLAIPAIVSGAYYRATEPTADFGLGVSAQRFPVRALAFARTEGLPFPVLHSLGDGAYVAFEGGPGSVFIDGRLEVYGGELVQRSLRILKSRELIEQAAAAAGVRTVVLRSDKEIDPILQLARDPQWAAVYFDSLNVVFLRREEATRELAERLAIDWKQPALREAPLPDTAWARARRPEDERDETALGVLLMQLNSLDAAREHLERAIAIAPRDVSARLHLAIVAEAQDRGSEAAEHLRHVPADLAERADVEQLRGSTLEQAGRVEPALAAYERAIAAGAPPGALLQHVLRAALALGRQDRARRALDDLTRVEPRNPTNWINLGLLCERMRDLPAARDAYVRALALQPRNPQLENQLGGVLVATGDVRGARAAFERVLAIDPNHAAARENLARLPR